MDFTLHLVAEFSEVWLPATPDGPSRRRLEALLACCPRVRFTILTDLSLPSAWSAWMRVSTRFRLAKVLSRAALLPAIAFGALMLGLALAFGLGGKELARELLARRFKREDPAQPCDLCHL